MNKPILKLALLVLSSVGLLSATYAYGGTNYIYGVRDVFIHGSGPHSDTHTYRFVGKTNMFEKSRTSRLPNFSREYLHWTPAFSLSRQFEFLIYQDDAKVLDLAFDEQRNYVTKGLSHCSPLKDLARIYPRPHLSSFVPAMLTTLACETPAGLIEISFYCDPEDECGTPN